jgi:hypothetical protein
VNLARRTSWTWLVAVVTAPVAIIAIANWFGANIH